MSSIVSTSTGDSSFVGKAGPLSLLGELGNAVAVGSEAGEDVDEVSAGYLDLKVRAFERETRRIPKHSTSARLEGLGCWPQRLAL